MASSSKKAHLLLWRGIVSECHEGIKPVTEHLSFLQKRFEELDSEGFIWSKESIFDIFVRLGLSGSPHDSSPPVHTALKSRVPQGYETSSIESGDVTWRPLGLMDLPIEVFEMILETLDAIAKLEAEPIFEQRAKGMVVISGPGDRKPYKTYLHRNSPILNSIQNFALTSREVYQRCQPRLWRRLMFPTRLPAPIDLWTNDILRQQGTHVQCLQVSLSKNCREPQGEFAEHDPFYDNLSPDLADDEAEDLEDAVDVVDVKELSPDNVRDLIYCCPNLSVVDIHSGHDAENQDSSDLSAFLSGLGPLLSNLKRLRHVTLSGSYGMKVANQFAQNVVANLPLLESLALNGFASNIGRAIGDGSLGYNISKLKYLSQLRLLGIDEIDENWCLYNWPRTITYLSIFYCKNSFPSSALRIIQHIAPYITKLSLSFPYQQHNDSGERDSCWNPQYRLSLPFLTDLNLSVHNAHLIASFQDCESLVYLEWTYRTSNHCRNFNKMLLQATWPRLNKLTVHVHWLTMMRAVDPQVQEINDQLVILEQHCRQSNLNATIRGPLERLYKRK